jgi:pyroglutamyl-peptidase
VVRVEARSRNVDDASVADNAGIIRASRPILPGALESHECPWQPRRWRDALLAAGIPARVSHDAGGFLCNHSYHHALASGSRAIFLHVPAPASPAGGWQRHEAAAFARVLARLIPLLAA